MLWAAARSTLIRHREERTVPSGLRVVYVFGWMFGLDLAEIEAEQKILMTTMQYMGDSFRVLTIAVAVRSVSEGTSDETLARQEPT